MKIFKEDLINKETQNITVFTGLISGLIKDEWEAIDGYNAAILSLSALEPAHEDAITIMNDIIKEEYIHIGQLEKLIQNIVPESNEIESGEEEAAAILDEEPADEEPVTEAYEAPEFIKSKSVPDTDGFMTDYAMYKDGDKYIFILGDTDIYGPENTDPDYEADTEEAANEWFNSYGKDDDEDIYFPSDDIDESIAETVDFSKKEADGDDN